jgi:hypothetical protein
MRHPIVYLTLFFTFLLGSHEGFIALWTSPGGNPIQVFPYSVASLPPEDQKRLEAGISLDSEEALIGLLEDYLS